MCSEMIGPHGSIAAMSPRMPSPVAPVNARGGTSVSGATTPVANAMLSPQFMRPPPQNMPPSAPPSGASAPNPMGGVNRMLVAVIADEVYWIIRLDSLQI